MGSQEGAFDTRLHEAVRYGDIEEVKVALQQSYDPNLIGLYQWSALHEASSNGESEIVKLLLSKKGDPNKKDLLAGNTSVHYAAQENHIDCLQLLIDAGGRYDIKNNDGKSCLDLATGECFSVLESLKVKDLMAMSTEEIKKQLEEAIQEKTCDQSTDHSNEVSQSGEVGLAEDIKPPSMGHLHLTFEHNSHKGTLKIKVWQLSNLLLPPPQISNIHSIYIKSFLLPDAKKDYKRKTEEVKVERSDAHRKIPNEKRGVQHIFTPSTFKFSKKLEYDGISASVVKEKSVQVEVCITQKYSKRSFLIGMLHMPLKEAVKKIVKEKYPLIPCVNHTIPANMRVNCASELQITNSAKIFYSNPDFRNLYETDMSEMSERASSDPDLKGVTMVKNSITPRNIVLNFGGEQDDKLDENVDSSERSVKVEIPGKLVEEEELNESGYSSITNVIDMTDITGDPVEPSRGSAFSSVVKHIKMNRKVGKLKETPLLKTTSEVSIDVEDWKYDEVKNKSGSRPETPTWDYYDLSMETVEIPVDEKEESPTRGDAPACLPMETTLGLMQTKVKKVKKPKNCKEERKILSTDSRNVPMIVVTDTESGVMSKSSIRTKKISSHEVAGTTSSKPKRHHLKKSSPETVSIDMHSLEKSNRKTKNNQYQVTADIHVLSAKASTGETSIDFGDNDSVIIDIENLETELKNVNLTDSVDNPASTSNHVVVMATEELSTNLTAMRPIPQQVFVEDSLYESSDEISEMSEFTLPFVPLTSQNNHMVSEV